MSQLPAIVTRSELLAVCLLLRVLLAVCLLLQVLLAVCLLLQVLLAVCLLLCVLPAVVFLLLRVLSADCCCLTGTQGPRYVTLAAAAQRAVGARVTTVERQRPLREAAAGAVLGGEPDAGGERARRDCARAHARRLQQTPASEQARHGVIPNTLDGLRRG